MPSCSPPSPLPISPSAPQRSSCVQLSRASACPEQEQPLPELLPLCGILPIAPFGRLRSVPELPRTAFEYRFLWRRCGQRPRARHQYREAPWSTDLVLSSADGLFRLDYPFSFPSGGIVSSKGRLWPSVMRNAKRVLGNSVPVPAQIRVEYSRCRSRESNG